jgi:hypothetical protein
MRKAIIGAAVLVLALVAIRRFGPALRKRAMSQCQEMFGRTSEGPPELMVRDLEEEGAALAGAPG